MEPRVLRNIVGGKPTETVGGRTSEIIDPVTEQVIALAPISEAEDVEKALRTAAEAFKEWRRSTPAARQLALLKLADAVEARAEEFAAVESRNTGKPVGLTRSEELVPIVDQLRFFAGAARLLEGRATGEYMDGHTSSIRREPVGVCAQVTPWNYPLLMAIWKIAPALAAGNTVVLKPSDTTPMSTLLLAEVAQEFFPAGVFNVVCGDRDTGRALVESRIPAMVSITGSVRAGMEVATAAAKDVKRVHLELGGKAPCLVFGDADLDAAAEGISVGGYFNAGQDCTAATRVLVHESVYDAFVEKLTAAAAATRTGLPDDEDVLYGPLNNAGQLERVQGFIERLPAHASVTTGGHRVGETGYFFAPTVVAHLNQDDEIIQNEVFGPVITVQKFSSDEQALEWANGVEYGLASSVWTASHSRALAFSRDLDFGCVWVNTHIPLVAEMPHGGFGHSGYGKDLSMYGFEDYTRVKHVMSAF